jgi:hypothetical protein
MTTRKKRKWANRGGIVGGGLVGFSSTTAIVGTLAAEGTAGAAALTSGLAEITSADPMSGASAGITKPFVNRELTVDYSPGCSEKLALRKSQARFAIS